MKISTFIYLLSLCTLSLFSPVAALAQGVIKGKITDSEFNDVLVGAVVSLEGTTQRTTTNLDGEFVFSDIQAGKHSLTATYIAFQSLKQTDIEVQSGDTTIVELSMLPEALVLAGAEIVAYVNMESESALLDEQREAVEQTQSVGAQELSRKGIGDAEAAVAQVSGISQQEGVKNVFVRGLGDRYNATLLNGFPVPSEDPEYKNIALDFFGTDVIKNIGISKVFNGSDYADVGGAIINISSKELVNKYALGVDISAGVNTNVFGQQFLQPDGANYFGFAGKAQPTGKQYSFTNSLDPSTLSAPLNHSYGISGGRKWLLGEQKNPLSFFLVASHSTDFYYINETVRNSTTSGIVYQDQQGKKYSQNTNQLVLANAMFDINNKHHLQYNFMLIHAAAQYMGEYAGKNGNRYDQPEYYGILRRQQLNDNLLMVNQLSADIELAKRWTFNAGLAYNTVTGAEPDRRESNFSKQLSDNYIFTGGGEQRRFFSSLTDKDFNAKAALTFKLKDKVDSKHSAIKIGYDGRFANSNFQANVYSFSYAKTEFALEGMKLDEWFDEAYRIEGRPSTGKEFSMSTGIPDSYRVMKNIHAGYATASYRFLHNLTGNIGFRMDIVEMSIDSKIQGYAQSNRQNYNFWLPSLNIRYDISTQHSLRLGASKTYTLPQTKEISPYQYVNISFTSQGNAALKASENYNVDLKWDWYISTSELLSLTTFYKHILNPIGRVDEGNSAGLLTYNNISPAATVAGVEFEIRKNLLDRFNTARRASNRLSAGMNASYIYTGCLLDIVNTDPRRSGLEGASPFLVNADLTYSYTKNDRKLTLAIVFNYFSDRIHTVGAMGFKDIVEKGMPTLHFAASYKFSKNLTVKLKADNLLNLPFKLERESSVGGTTVLNEYRKGQAVSIGLSYEL